MTDKKLTAVEWLEERFEKFLAWHEGHHKATPYTLNELSNDFEQAKALEREQIELCGDKCQIITDVDPDGNVKFMYKGGSEYFTKNYGDNVNPDLQKP